MKGKKINFIYFFSKQKFLKYVESTNKKFEQLLIICTDA